MADAKKNVKPWYAGEHQDLFYYLMIAIFFVEMAVGGVSFFYGIIHAEPEVTGGPPVARFPWLVWAIAAVLAPVALILVVHLAGTWVSSVLNREENQGANSGIEDEHLPEGMKRFYASVRHAPTVVLLVALLLAGATLFFMDGALFMLAQFGKALIPYIPWIAGSLAALLAICFLSHAILVYRQRKMENEYAWRREVLEKTGMVLMDKSSMALPQNSSRAALLASEDKKDNVLDVTPKKIGPSDGIDNSEDK